MGKKMQSVLIVVAMNQEADPIIEKLGLKADPESTCAVCSCITLRRGQCVQLQSAM